MNEIKIHDIKALVEVPDYSFYIFYGLIILGILFVLLIAYLLYKFFKKKKENKRQIYINILKNLDFTNSKKCAYDITKYGQLLANNIEEKHLLKDLISKLEDYKYKKDINTFDTKTKASIDIFIDSLI